MARRRSYTEADVRVRPNRKGSRPRSKQRPDHADAVPGLVTAVDRGRYQVLTDAGVPVVAVKARELGRGAVVVGDRVDLVGDVSGAEGTLARVVRVQDRRTLLRRSADDTDPTERGIVANADQLVIVTALADPEPRPRMVDRFLVAAFDAGMDALLVLTKSDLVSEAFVADFVSRYGALDVQAVATRRDHSSSAWVDTVAEHLDGRVSVLVGHSGVGKSTLVNALVPDADRATGDVNEVTGRGRHTSSSAVALPLPAGGWIIDTPGVRSFGLAHVDPGDFVTAFEDLAQVAAQCPRGCTHTEDAPDCALDPWAESGTATDRARLDSFRRLLASRQGVEG
ncbi:ribosome small subunit-dependent GTPase A [Ruania alkalisoli]|uniref:Small ribosomal subunit biogenesis GTPase RsgA n=1 Tax=Ruania alkalisoli TaxID=2779775 RepID=A0A7M1SRS9_9MICO|nr:ribosome small subunit-dependent GTPase A [Ruania alkalisoli]QOR69684.1 ribosome small subunit-dependent GTPase A [Ruania alkalisoli]